MIQGVHHVGIKCADAAKFEETVFFYKEILGLKEARSWAGGCMLDTGNGLIEILQQDPGTEAENSHCHFAFQVDEPDLYAAKAAAAGYQVTIEPKDIRIPSDPVYPARIAFVRGPVGESVEFFQVR